MWKTEKNERNSAKIENRTNYQVWNMCYTTDYSSNWSCSYVDKCSWSPETFLVFGNFRVWNSAPHNNRDQSWGIRLRLTLKLGSMQQSLRMNDLLRTLLKRLLCRRWTFELADIEQSSGELVVKKASTTFISTSQNHLRVSFDPEEGNFENLKTLVEKRMVRKHCMPTTKRKLALAKFGNRKVLQSPQRLDAGWPLVVQATPGNPLGTRWEPLGGSIRLSHLEGSIRASCCHCWMSPLVLVQLESHPKG